ncbi:hypothetical protein FF124_13490 [Martelella lutilitoris]|uniref:Extensin-like C-terminal domain-containing protein n=2 Tax=Martelella lutilitoris TaxID=2583532 RepID=A0A5C4JPX5_9HYPH|nr:hypothetical protein FF124_13490 [Martelella lutilitoris]
MSVLLALRFQPLGTMNGMASFSHLRNAVSCTAISLVLAGCSIGGLMTSFSVDTSAKDTQVVTRSEAAKAKPAAVVSAPAPQPSAAELAKDDPPPQSIEQLIAETETSAGLPIDSYLGFSETEDRTDVAAIADTEARSAEAQTDAAKDPGIDPINTASLLPHVDPGAGTDAGQGSMAEPKQNRIPGLMPLAERQCRSELNAMGVTFSEVEAIASGSQCGIAYPVKLQKLPGNIAISPDVTVNCETALAFAQWVQADVAPAVRVRYLTGLKSIETMGGYSCRRVNNGTNSRTMSEHSKGNAIDIGGFTLNTGKTIDVSPKGFFAFREKGLLKSVRASGCEYFNTVLGPGYPKHDDHFHFDLKQRSSGRTYCN